MSLENKMYLQKIPFKQFSLKPATCHISSPINIMFLRDADQKEQKNIKKEWGRDARGEELRDVDSSSLSVMFSASMLLFRSHTDLDSLVVNEGCSTTHCNTTLCATHTCTHMHVLHNGNRKPFLNAVLPLHFSNTQCFSSMLHNPFFIPCMHSAVHSYANKQSAQTVWHLLRIANKLDIHMHKCLI